MAAMALAAALVAAAVSATPAAAEGKHRHKRAGHFPAACPPASSDPALKSFVPGDAWRFSKEFKFPFRGATDNGLGAIIWKYVPGVPIPRGHFPTPNLPTCRVGRFGTEDRGSIKAGEFFPMLEPVDGSFRYELKDTFDRPVATLQYFATPPVKYHPSKWGWFIDGKWAGHDATRAFELQGRACKFVAQESATGPVWVRDPNYLMIAFNPSLGSPGHPYSPRRTYALRVRAFIDRRAIPPALLEKADRYDFGCGAPVRPRWQQKRTLSWYVFHTGYGPGRSYMRGYYFGQRMRTLGTPPGPVKLFNNYPLSNYNPRPQFHHATYAMVATTAVAGGGMVRGIVRTTRDRLSLYDEMRYCDPNFTLRGARLKRGKARYAKSLFWPPETFSPGNRPAVRWVFGRIDPDPKTLTAFQAAADHNKASPRLFAWMPIYCDR